jgi:hypothetical protein
MLFYAVESTYHPLASTVESGFDDFVDPARNEASGTCLFSSLILQMVRGPEMGFWEMMTEVPDRLSATRK